MSFHFSGSCPKGEADDTSEPLVEVVLVLRLLGLHHLGGALAGHELGAAALGEVAGELGVPVILELLDLIRRPALLAPPTSAQENTSDLA